MNRNMMALVAVILIIVAGVGGFYAGLQYQKSQISSQFVGRGGGNGQGLAGRFGGQSDSNFTPVRGQILNIDNNSITVKEANGTTKIVVLSSTTVFVQSQKASESDLKTGNTVMVIGSTNSDGSVTASNVSINPEQFRPSTTPPKGQ